MKPRIETEPPEPRGPLSAARIVLCALGILAIAIIVFFRGAI